VKAVRSFPVRKFLFLAFVAGYAVACPLLILYALGYIVQPSGEELRRTGGIFVASIPPGASLSLDGKPYPRKSPVAMLRLRPGPYRIRLDLHGYRPWEERVSVRPGRVTVLDSLLLVPVHRTYADVAPDWFLDMIPAPGYPYVILMKGTGARDVVVYDIPGRRFISVIDERSALRNALVTGCLTVGGSSEFLLETVNRASLGILGVRIQRPRAMVQDLTEVLPAQFEDPQWAVGSPEVIFSYNGSSVDRTNVRTGTVTRGIVTQVSGYGLDGRWLYAISWQRHLLRFDLENQTRQDLSRFDGAVEGFPLGRFVSVRPVGADLILLWSQGRRFTAAGPAFRESATEVRGYQADSRTGRVLLWQAHRLAIIEKRAGASAPALQWLDVDAKDIQQACFVTESTNVLYRDGSSIFLAGRLQDHEWRVNLVATARLGTSMYYAEREGKLYYIDPETGRLFTTVIVPRQQILDLIVQQLRQDSGH
jgi:PEGA domain